MFNWLMIRCVEGLYYGSIMVKLNRDKFDFIVVDLYLKCYKLKLICILCRAII